MDELPFIDLLNQKKNISYPLENPVQNEKLRVLAIASSTGGTDALEVILRDLPADCIPVVIVQHIPAGFTGILAERLNSISEMEVKEASDGDILKRGLALIAPADSHTRLNLRGGNLVIECFIGERVFGLMPAADILFESISRIIRDKALGVVLTGMGVDGAEGLLKMRRQGARTIAQDKDSCVIYGMPKKAFEIGAAEFVLPLERIAGKIIDLYSCRAY